MQQALTEDVRGSLWLLMGAVVLVLLIAAANVGSLLLARGTGRMRELAIRGALGATADRNLRTVVVDATKPIAAGLLIGAAGACAASPALRSVLFEVEPLAPGPFAVVSATLLVAGVVAAAVAALPIRRIDPIEALKVE